MKLKRKTIENITKPKSGSLKNISLGFPREKTQITNIRNEKENITTDHMNTKRIINTINNSMLTYLIT